MPKIIVLAIALVLLEGCASTVIAVTAGAVTTIAVEAVKIPFKVAGAAIDVVTDDDDEEED